MPGIRELWPLTTLWPSLPPTTEGLPGATVAWVPITLPPVLRAQVYLASCVTLSTPLATWNLNVLTLEMGTRPVSLGYWRGVGGVHATLRPVSVPLAWVQSASATNRPGDLGKSLTLSVPPFPHL